MKKLENFKYISNPNKLNKKQNKKKNLCPNFSNNIVKIYQKIEYDNIERVHSQRNSTTRCSNTAVVFSIHLPELEPKHSL